MNLELIIKNYYRLFSIYLFIFICLLFESIDNVVLGGTHQENDLDCTPRKEDFEFIRNGCCRILPALKVYNLIKFIFLNFGNA